jgi:pimeloyl-ACP methyl ester carboxylesterase
VTIQGVKPALRDHWLALAHRYRGPVKVIWGREDRVLPVTHAAEAREVLPQAEIDVIERCGHLPMIERTDAFLAALLPFLERAEAAAAA